MMKKNLLAVIALSILSVTAFTQTQKTAYADVDYILSQLPEFKNIQSELQTYRSQLQKQYEAKVQEYQQKVQTYQQEEATMVDAIKADRQRDIRQMEQNIRQFEMDMQESFSKKQQTLLNPVYEKIGNAIETVAKEEGYTFVLTTRANGMDVLLYGEEQYDLSDTILRKLGVTP